MSARQFRVKSLRKSCVTQVNNSRAASNPSNGLNIQICHKRRKNIQMSTCAANIKKEKKLSGVSCDVTFRINSDVFSASARCVTCLCARVKSHDAKIRK